MSKCGPMLVVGADGMIGGALLERLSAAGAEATGTSRRADAARRGLLHLDLALPPDQWDLPDAVCVAFVCAGITSLRSCRENPAATMRVNVEQTLELAAHIVRRGGRVVVLSTNQVFDGRSPRRKVDDAPSPRSVYGEQKAAVEAAVAALDEHATVVRLTKVVGETVPLFDEWATRLADGQSVEAFSDLQVAPVPLAFAVDALVCIGQQHFGGIVHLSGDEDISYEAIARRLAAVIGVDGGLVMPVAVRERGIPGEEAPPHTTLDVSTLPEQLGLTAPTSWETIERLLARTCGRL